MIANPELAPTFKPIMTPTPTKEQIQSIYRDIGEIPGIKEDLQGWNSTAPIFGRLIHETQAKVIIEIGVWKGASTVHMAQTALCLNLNTLIYSVDFWQDPILQTAESQIPRHWSVDISAYQQFLYNVWVNRCDDRVIPIRTYSPHGAKLLQVWGIKADLIYVDAGHTYQACLGDMTDYWPLLRSGGVMFGDDIMEPGVMKAVRQFSLGMGFTHDDHHWQLPPKS